MASDPWRLNNAALLNQIATLAWANEGGDGAAMQQFYSSGRILYEIYSRFKQVGEQEKAIRRAAYVEKITEYVEANKRLSKEKLAAGVQKIIAEFASEIN